MSNIADKVVVITGASQRCWRKHGFALLAGNGAKSRASERGAKIGSTPSSGTLTPREGSALGCKTDVTKRGDVEALVRGTV